MFVTVTLIYINIYVDVFMDGTDMRTSEFSTNPLRNSTKTNLKAPLL